MRKTRRAERGITLIEMLVVVTIIALFAALVGPKLFTNVDKAKRTQVRAQMYTDGMFMGEAIVPNGDIGELRPVGASLPIILAATAAGLFLATIWAMAVGQSAVALVSGVFAGFWLSYAFLLLGIMHAWFGITVFDLRSTQELFLTAWIVVFSMLTLATLRLALAFSLLFFLVDVALIFVLVSVANTSTNWQKAGGAVVLLFATLGIFIFFGTASVATGGKAIPLGRPLLPLRRR